MVVSSVSCGQGRRWPNISQFMLKQKKFDSLSCMMGYKNSEWEECWPLACRPNLRTYQNLTFLHCSCIYTMIIDIRSRWLWRWGPIQNPCQYFKNQLISMLILHVDVHGCPVFFFRPNHHDWFFYSPHNFNLCTTDWTRWIPLHPRPDASIAKLMNASQDCRFCIQFTQANSTAFIMAFISINICFVLLLMIASSSTSTNWSTGYSKIRKWHGTTTSPHFFAIKIILL